METIARTELFNAHGVRIPYGDLEQHVTAPDDTFYFTPPTMTHRADFRTRLGRLNAFLPELVWPTLDYFWHKSMMLIERLYRKPAFEGLLDGPCLPLALPFGDIADRGTHLAEVILPAVAASYYWTYPQRRFANCCHSELPGRIWPVFKSGLHSLIARQRYEPQVALYFPDALRGWSVFSSRAQMATLPSRAFVLPDPIIHALALISYPDILARDYFTPGLDCAAMSDQRPLGTLFFWAQDDTCILSSTLSPAAPHDHYSSGLLYLG